MGRRYERLTVPMVRDGGSLREATWAEALVRAADGFARTDGAATGDVLVLEGDERGELRRAEARTNGARHEQHRQLQPHLTRSLRRRSGGSARSGRRHVVL